MLIHFNVFCYVHAAYSNPLSFFATNQQNSHDFIEIV
jgi:hypothetical protein